MTTEIETTTVKPKRTRKPRVEAPVLNGNLSLRQAAHRLGHSPHTVRLWAVYQNRLPYVRMSSRALRFRMADIEAFEAAHIVAAKP
jgi:hypothetical protein